jgi:hypothetical protein
MTMNLNRAQLTEHHRVFNATEPIGALASKWGADSSHSGDQDPTTPTE